MQIKQIQIEGNGVFGSFLKTILSPHCDIVNTADIVILAVPFSAYEDVASKYKNKLLVNVCSVQEETNRICLKYSDQVLGIHPMFGPRSPEDGRTSIVTLDTVYQNPVLELFSKISAIITHYPDGRFITGKLHDEMMAKTHLQVIKISDMISKIVYDARDIPDDFLPTSFKRLKSMADQFLDMPPGTKESILANKYGH